ncbi:hypothetical protein [Roseomonas sp. USHLN139]|uniref:hypothetical protein n=1 Tax=Roseomonas sp. USHLN139 TaxID=3081298 RepID=UPI003B029177
MAETRLLDATPKPRLLGDTGRIAAFHRPAAQPEGEGVLLIAFAPLGARRGPWDEAFLAGFGASLVTLVDYRGCWYRAEEMAQLLPALRALAAQHRRVVLLGAGMGGHAALRHAAALRADLTLAFSAPYSMDPEMLGGLQGHQLRRHYQAWLHRGVRVRPEELQGRVLLFFDPLLAEDRRQAALIEASGDCRAVPCPAAGADTLRFARQSGLLEGLLARALRSATADAASARRLRRQGRRRSADYLAGMAARLRGRGRPEAALRLLGQALAEGQRSGLLRLELAHALLERGQRGPAADLLRDPKGAAMSSSTATADLAEAELDSLWEASARLGLRPAFPAGARFRPPADDPAWTEVAAFLAGRIRPGDRVLAPRALWSGLLGGAGLADLPEAAARYDWVVAHKGRLRVEHLDFWQRLPAAAVAVFANAVFVVWQAKPATGRADLAGTPHGRAYAARLRALAAEAGRPEPGWAKLWRRLSGRAGGLLPRAAAAPSAPAAAAAEPVALPDLPVARFAEPAPPPDTERSHFRMPLFLLRPPADPALPHRFAPPSIARPVSQLCTAAQFEEPAYARLATRLGMQQVGRRHRKNWEFCYILAAIEEAGLLQPGLRAIGFGTGREPLPAALAAAGLQVLATDAPLELQVAQGWAQGGQHSADVMTLHRPKLLPKAQFIQRVSHRGVDMNAIPGDLAGFDIAWSACALEHLGSLRHGLDFIEASLGCLRPGGLAVHTTEFNLSSETATFEHPGCSIYRKPDIEGFLARMHAAGHEVFPLNLHPGESELDAVIDLPPFLAAEGKPHLKLELRRFVSTSIGLMIRKGR